MLTGKNALQSDVNQPWEQTNQAWWDWYVTLADNSGQQTGELYRTDRRCRRVESPSDAAIFEELGAPYTLTRRHREAFSP